MRTVRLDDHLAAVRARKRELGVVETPEYVEARRNKGGTRTPEKRELLRRCEERTRAAGLLPTEDASA